MNTGINIPQIEPQYEPFFRFPGCFNSDNVSSIETAIESLTHLFIFCENKMKTKAQIHPYIPDKIYLSILPPYLKFLIFYQNTLIAKYNNAHLNFYHNNTIIISNILSYLTFFKNNRIFVLFDLEQFNIFLKDNRKNDPKLNKYSKKITFLIKYLEIQVPRFCNPKIPKPKAILTILNHSYEAYKEDSEYLQLNSSNLFDYIFPLYVAYFDFSPIFSLLLSKLTSTTVFVDKQLYHDPQELKKASSTILPIFQSSLKEIAVQLGINSSKQAIILRYTFLRYIYSQSYIVQPFGLKSKLESKNDQFLQKCALIQAYTPKDLQLGESLFTEEQYNSPIKTLIHFPEVFQANSFFKSLQFYVCPIDISYYIKAAISYLEIFAKKNSMIKKAGPFVKMIYSEDDIMAPLVLTESSNEKKDLESNQENNGNSDSFQIITNFKSKNEMLSLDDCLCLMIMAIAIDPPINAVYLSEWLKTAPDIFKNAQLKHGILLFISVVEELTNFVMHQFTRRPSTDISNFELTDDDPLGISVNDYNH